MGTKKVHHTYLVGKRIAYILIILFMVIFNTKRKGGSMKKLSLISIVAFLVSVFVLGRSLLTTSGDLFSGPVMIAICIILPIIGLLAALISNKGALKFIGITGNSLILLFSVIVPAVSTLFWNQP